MEANEYIEQTRIRSLRRKKRMQRDASDKALIRMHMEEDNVLTSIRNLGWTLLDPPVQKGFVRFFVLRPDVKRTKQAAFFEKLLAKINTHQLSYRKDFKRKRKKFGKKVYVIREQHIREIFEWEFHSRKFTDDERQYFYEVMTHTLNCKKPVKAYRFVEPWRFVLRVQPNMITKVRIKDLDLEKKSAEIDRYFDHDRRLRLWKLLNGNAYSWKSRAQEKYLNPFDNRSFTDILSEHWPEPKLIVVKINPRNTGGSFLYVLYRVIQDFLFLCTAHTNAIH